MMSSRVKFLLQTYCITLGGVSAFAGFSWIALQLYVLSLTASDATDLLMARYLDISFGVLAFTAALSLAHGSFVQSRCWLSAWAVGAATVVIGQWCWLFYQDYVKKSPESLSQMHSVIIIGTLLYVLLAVPVLPFYRQLRQERVVTRSSAPVSTGRWKDKTPRTTTVTLSTSASKRQEGRHDLV